MLPFLNINNNYQLLGHTKDPCGQSSLVNPVGMLFTNKDASYWCYYLPSQDFTASIKSGALDLAKG